MLFHTTLLASWLPPPVIDPATGASSAGRATVTLTTAPAVPVLRSETVKVALPVGATTFGATVMSDVSRFSPPCGGSAGALESPSGSSPLTISGLFTAVGAAM